MRKLLLLFVLLPAFSFTQNVSVICKSAEEKITAKNFSGAIEDFTKAIEENKSLTSEALKQISVQAADAKRVSHHEIAMPFCRRGMLYLQLGKNEEARKDLDMALTLDQNYGEAYFHRSFLNKDSKDNSCIDLRLALTHGYEAATMAFDENFCWNASLAYYKEGLTKLNVRKFEEAIAQFDLAAKLNPDSASTFLKRGQAYNALGKKEAAVTDFEKAISLDSKRPESYYWLAQSLITMEKPKEAYDQLSKAVSLRATYYEAFNARAKVDEALGEFNSAVYDYTQCIRLKPTDGNAYYRRGLIKRDKLEDPEGACADFKKALSLDCYDAEEVAEECK